MRVMMTVLAGAAAFSAACCDPCDPELPVPCSGDTGAGPKAVERRYGVSVSEVADAVRRTIPTFDLTLESDVHDAMGGTITARHPGGHRVIVTFAAADPGTTRVWVHVAPGSRRMMEMIHDRIARILTDEPG